MSRHTGYGRAYSELFDALQRNGAKLNPSADLVINFCMPKDYIFRDYTIGYTPWESTEVPAGWLEKMHRVDQLWTTSNWTSGIFRGLTGRFVWVLHHGLNYMWQPFKHERRDTPFTFIHVGEPALRKGGDIVLEAWHKAFRKSPHRLIFKCTGIPMCRVKDRGGSIIYSPGHLMGENGTVLNTVFTDAQMADFYHDVDCLLYPTRGEGFGFIPLEAMATGLPTILPMQGGTGDFAKLGIALEKSIWHSSDEIEHPGLWLDHDVDEVIELMNDIIEHYDTYSENAYENAFILKEQFDWDKIAQRLINRLAQI